MADLSPEEIKEKADKQRFDAVFGHWPALVGYLKGPEHVYTMANSYFLDFFGGREIIGKTIREALPELVGQGLLEIIEQVYKSEEPFVGTEMPVKIKINDEEPLRELFVNFVYQPVYTPEGAMDGILFHAVDVTEQVQSREKIEETNLHLYEAKEALKHLSLHDPLTGLPNRKSLEDRLDLVLSLAKRDSQMVAVMFLDIDRFKHINDTLGHHVGDTVLKEISERLKAAIEKEDTVARVGGDEFIIMITEITRAEEALLIADRILRSLESPIRIENKTLHLSGSIGIALFPNDGDDHVTLLRNADTAAYRAKESGRNRYQLYNQTMNAEATERFALGNDLREAIGKGELEVFYQPIVDARTNKVMAVEALVRWNHPAYGLVYPNEFIPIAEELGIISDLGKWVLRETCSQHQKWMQAGHPPIRIAVNLSPLQFSDDKLISVIATILKETGMDPAYLELEITESVAMEDAEHTREILLQLKKMGLTITMDDFGTGYSSLSYLRRFPLDNLKIDKSFVRKGFLSTQDSKIIRTIVSMAHNMNLRVCAEGVETMEQLHYLKSLRCYRMQGFHFSKALPAAEFLEWSKSFLRHKR